MKKIFTLAAASLFAFAASAQVTFKTLDKTLVFYLTNDTVSTQTAVIEDPDTGEEIEATVAKPWDISSMIGAFNACGIGLAANTEDLGYTVKIRNNYTDNETGFSMPAGLYRGATCTRSRFTLQGNLNDGSSFKGFKNCSKMILYFIPVPTAWLADGSISHQDYPTGRVEATYLNDEGTAVSNTAYREIHISQRADPNNTETQVFQNTNILNFERDAANPHFITVDQPYKLTVNLQNANDAQYYESLFAADDKKGEFVNLMADSATTEASMDYYFGDVTEIHPYADNAETTGSTATGYSVYDNKWSTKIAWTANTPISLAVKYRMYLVGAAVVSATEGAGSQFMNASELANATWHDAASAYGVYTDASGISNVNAKANTDVNAPMYNLAGQRVSKSYKGIVIQNGKKFINK